MSTPQQSRLETLLVHSGWVRGLARRLSANGADADDLEQETWLRVLRAPPRQDTGVRAWLKVVLTNALRDGYRSETQRARRECAVAARDGADATATLVAEAEYHQMVAREVLRLPEPYVSALLLRYYKGLLPQAIATRLDVPVDTVHTRLKRARGRLRAALQRRDREGSFTRRARGTWVLPAVRGWNSKGVVLVSTSTKKWIALVALALVLLCAVVVFTPEPAIQTPPVPREGGALETKPTLESDAVRQPATAAVPAASDQLRVASLTIRVSRGGNAPVQGALVSAYRHNLHQPTSWLRQRTTYDDPVATLSVRTDERGEARLDALRIGGWTVVATHAGFAPSGVEIPRLSDEPKTRTIDLRLEPGGRVSGRVFDAAGRPVGGALLIASRAVLGRRGAVEVRARTSESGAYGFENLPNGLLSLQVRAPRHAVYRVGSIVSPMANAFDIHLPPTGAVAGTLLGPTGTPIARARVELHMWARGFAETTTDANGHYELFTERPIRVALLTARVPGLVLDPVQPYYHLAAAHIGSCLDIPPPVVGETRRVDIRLVEGGVVEGRVLGPGGPVPLARVRATTTAREPSTGAFATQADAAGNYRLEGLPAGLLLLRAEHESYIHHGLPRDGTRLMTVRSGGSDPLSVRVARGATARLDLTMARGDKITGRVVTRTGDPIAGATVWAGQPVEPMQVSRAHSASDGSFTLTPVDLSQKGWVTVRHPHFISPVCIAIEPTDGRHKEIELTLDPYRVVRGRVVGADGQLPPNTSLRVVSFGGANRTEVWTKFLHAPQHPIDSDGAFEVRVPLHEQAVGGVWLRASAPGYAQVQVGPLRVESGGPVPEIELTLERGNDVTLVVSGHDGSPIPGASIALVAYDSTNAIYQTRAYRDPTDAQGRTTLRALPAGRFFADVSAPGFAPMQIEWVLPGRTELEVALPRAKRIVGHVKTETGVSVLGAMVHVSPRSAAPRGGPGTRAVPTVREIRVDADGQFVVGGLASGRYRVVVTPPRRAKGLGVVTLESVPAGASDLAILLPKAGIIIGRVRQPAGYPVHDVTVRAIAADDPQATWEAKTQPDGTFKLGGLRGERFTVRVETPRWGKIGKFAWAEKQDVEPSEAEVDFILALGATIEGRVVGSRGEGVPGLPIGTYDKWVVTGEDGAFVLRGLRKGAHELRVQSWANRTGYRRLEAADAVEAGSRGVELRAAR